MLHLTSLPPVILFTLAALAITAAVYDCRFRRIPNWLNLSGIILGFGWNLVFFHLHGAGRAAEGMLLAMAVYLPFYLLRGMGAGDVKLMAAIGSLVGPANWLVIFIATALAGGIAGAGFSLFKRRFTETCCNVYFLAKDLLHFRAPYRTNPQLDFRNTASLRLPHGLVIAVGCAAAVACSVSWNTRALGSF
jgi:prepilin peptidase CpaA